jgi:hypothetical protein
VRITLLLFCCLLSLLFDAQQPQRGTLCTETEKVLFSCSVKRSAKVVSLCASSDVSRTRGYVQYRFGTPGKIELEYPAEKANSQDKFAYHHYFRAQLDETEVSFSSGGYKYAIFDDYNGEMRPAVSSQGVRVESTGNGKDSTLECQGKAKASYGDLDQILPTREN